jgi:carbonic anhydrase
MHRGNHRLAGIVAGILVGAIGVATGTAIILGTSAGSAMADDAVQCNEARPPTPTDAVKALVDGNDRWSTGKTRHPGRDFARRECVAKEGQTPFAAVIACSDSRVPTELIFDEGVGDVFVVRVAGNSVDKLGEQSLGYSAEHLGVETILVLGHQKCGAVKAAVESYPKPTAKFLSVIYDAIAKAKEIIHSRGGNVDNKDDLSTEATDQHVILQVNYLRGVEPFKGLIAAGKLKIVGGRYDLDSGHVTMLIQ